MDGGQIVEVCTMAIYLQLLTLYTLTIHFDSSIIIYIYI